MDEHRAATAAGKGRQGAASIDETLLISKDMDKDVTAQAELVEIVHTAKQFVCVPD